MRSAGAQEAATRTPHLSSRPERAGQPERAESRRAKTPTCDDA
jgi:hypothetical protein